MAFSLTLMGIIDKSKLLRSSASKRGKARSADDARTREAEAEIGADSKKRRSAITNIAICAPAHKP